MANDGKWLESLVAEVEELLLPSGMTVAKNRRIFNDAGVQIAEFDVEVSGRVGTVDIQILLQCRDRPSTSSEPGEWIESLDGRRRRFGLSKIIAVSTSGFSPSALQAAKELKIELRVVRQGDNSEVSKWLGIEEMSLFNRVLDISAAQLFCPPDQRERLQQRLAKPGTSGRNLILAALDTRVELPADQLMTNIFSNAPEFAHINDGPVNARVSLLPGFELATENGPVTINRVDFRATVRPVERKLRAIRVDNYVRLGSEDAPIAQLVAFEPFRVGEHTMRLEFHKIEDGGTQVLLRKVAGSGDPET